MLARTLATRFVTPLREGGSLPGLVEAADLGTYVCKFRSAGQGLKVLVAEVLVAELARRLDLRTPRQVVLDLTDPIARYEADEEVQDLLTASLGSNLGIDFLPGAYSWDAAGVVPDDEAAAVLWLDAFTANVDRSWRNPNLLLWHRNLWLIDHGAALYFHHSWSRGTSDPQRWAAQTWSADGHVFARHAQAAAERDPDLRARLTPAVLTEVVAAVPGEWLEPVPGAETEQAVRDRYLAHLTARLASRAWLPEATS